MLNIFDEDVSKVDPVIADLLEQERERVRDTLQLIPSENFASHAVLQTVGSIVSNKYAEGYPNARYYEGNEFVDQMELLAIERAKSLFGAEHANVQPLSGGPANMCVFSAVLENGDKVLSMDLAQGGHLTHGATVNFSGKQYSFVHYPVDQDTHRIDYEVVRAKALEERPKLIIAGASCYPREINFDIFAEIAKEVGAILLADISHIAGLVATGVHPDVFPYADIVTTTTHKTLRGPRGAIILSKKEYAKAIDKAVFPRIQAGPHMNTIAAKAVAFGEAQREEFYLYSKMIVDNAAVLAEELLAKGWKLTTGGTDNHLMLMDLRDSELDGAVGAAALASAGIIANKNLVPYDHRSPKSPSGIRLGTPAMTSRGLRTEHMRLIAEWIDQVLKNPEDTLLHSSIRREIKDFLSDFPIYPSFA